MNDVEVIDIKLEATMCSYNHGFISFLGSVFSPKEESVEVFTPPLTSTPAKQVPTPGICYMCTRILIYVLT